MGTFLFVRKGFGCHPPYILATCTGFHLLQHSVRHMGSRVCIKKVFHFVSGGRKLKKILSV